MSFKIIETRELSIGSLSCGSLMWTYRDFSICFILLLAMQFAKIDNITPNHSFIFKKKTGKKRSITQIFQKQCKISKFKDIQRITNGWNQSLFVYIESIVYIVIKNKKINFPSEFIMIFCFYFE